MSISKSVSDPVNDPPSDCHHSNVERDPISEFSSASTSPSDDLIDPLDPGSSSSDAEPSKLVCVDERETLDGDNFLVEVGHGSDHHAFIEVEENTFLAIQHERERASRIEEQKRFYRDIQESLNIENSRLVLDYDILTRSPRVEVDPILVEQLKPHQREGIKFMYNNVIESVDKINKPGSGCILAHYHGLGKTLQVITLVHTLLSNPLTNKRVGTVLIILNQSALKSWIREFDEQITKRGLSSLKIYVIQRHAKALNTLRAWATTGGVLITESLVIQKFIFKDDEHPLPEVPEFLVNPGPDLVIIDDAYPFVVRLWRAILSIWTPRKIILSREPLEIDLNAYYAKVNVIKPHLLGSISEFDDRYREPIENGQKIDSTAEEMELMKARLIELRLLISGCFQRFGVATLNQLLKPKFEYALIVRPTQQMVNMYNYLYDRTSQDQLASKTSKEQFMLTVNHPALIQINRVKDKMAEMGWNYRNFDQIKGKKEKFLLDGEWTKNFIRPSEWNNIGLSGKFFMLFKILEGCIKVGDKLIVISYSPETLDHIERCLKQFRRIQIDGENVGLKWNENVHYFRLDSSHDTEKNARIVDRFNDQSNEEARLLLSDHFILKVNHLSANRCIVFDSSQHYTEYGRAANSLYRLGQEKSVFIYRFITKGTFEASIFRKHSCKCHLGICLIDPKLNSNYYKNEEQIDTYDVKPKEGYDIALLDPPQDDLLADIISDNNEHLLQYIKLESFDGNFDDAQWNDQH